MSHFTVGVIVKNPHDLEETLAPYCEQDENYMVRDIAWFKDDYIRDYREQNQDTCLTDEAIWEAAEVEYGPELCDDEHIYTFYNPDARWDWWVIGGRWRYQLKVPKGVPSIVDQDLMFEKPLPQRGRYRKVDGARIKDILWHKMNQPTRDEIKQYARFWDVAVEGQPLEEGENIGFCYRPEYYRDLYGNKENYIMKQSTFYTHDLLDGIEGEWHTMGDMGWFGCDNATGSSLDNYLNKFYGIIRNPEYQDYWFIVVDCHV